MPEEAVPLLGRLLEGCLNPDLDCDLDPGSDLDLNALHATLRTDLKLHGIRQINSI